MSLIEKGSHGCDPFVGLIRLFLFRFLVVILIEELKVLTRTFKGEGMDAGAIEAKADGLAAVIEVLTIIRNDDYNIVFADLNVKMGRAAHKFGNRDDSRNAIFFEADVFWTHA